MAAVKEIRLVSVVCPFFNEETIIRNAIKGMVDALGNLPWPWELVCVNDGSTDSGAQVAEECANSHPGVRVIGYQENRGRGYALRHGIRAANGDIIVTTEIDLSWGERTVHNLVAALVNQPDVDAVIASPNLRGGGYRNVARKRVLISKLGNQLIKRFFPVTLSMNTGMTRAYRASVIKGYQFEENGKEFHLEVILKLALLGHKLSEIPAVLEWKDHKLLLPGALKRKSSTRIRKTAWNHLHFVAFANPISYLWAAGVLFLFIAALFFVYSVHALLTGNVAIYSGLVGGILSLFSLVLFVFGVVTNQANKILIELWRIQKSSAPEGGQ
jgi:glycosyltransferase involved in cell wall biosynthesis